jgi:hypothetical protein
MLRDTRLAAWAKALTGQRASSGPNRPAGPLLHVHASALCATVRLPRCATVAHLTTHLVALAAKTLGKVFRKVRKHINQALRLLGMMLSASEWLCA